jgi:LacI family transcriptional regulator
MRKRFTIEDVAKLAGVGKVTVSYVLNGQANTMRISRDTCERVQTAARELDYRPSAIARSLASKRSNAITLVFQHGDYFSTGSSFINEAMRGVCEACVAADVNLILHTRNFHSPEDEAHAIMDGRSDGALILRDDNDPVVDELLKRGFPTLLFFSRHSNQSYDFIDSDNFEGGRIATEHLLSLGHENISVVLGPTGSTASRDRYAGHLAAVNRLGLKHDQSKIKVIPTPDAVDSTFIDWVKQTESTALMCWSDDVAFACMSELKLAHYKLPEDLSVIGFDSSIACDRFSPPLTSMRQPIYEMALQGAQQLIAKTMKLNTPSKQHLYPLTLDVRNSTTRPKVTSSMKRKS